jgi:hypothetical protein
LIDKGLGHRTCGLAVGLFQEGQGRFHQANQLGPLHGRLRKRVFRLDEQFRNGQLEGFLPLVEHAERQIGGFFLPADFLHVHVHAPRQSAARYALQAADRCQPVQRAVTRGKTIAPAKTGVYIIKNAHDSFLPNGTGRTEWLGRPLAVG